MVDMSSILGRAASTVEAPKALPPGDYLFRVMSYTDKTQDGKPLVSQNGNPKLDFSVQAETALDVSPEALEGVNFPAKMYHRFTITEASLFRLVDFLTHCGLSKEGQTVAEMLPQAVGATFRGTVVHQASTKPGDDRLYANIAQTGIAG